MKHGISLLQDVRFLLRDSLSWHAVVGEEGRESEELQKAFLVLLHALTANGLVGVILELEGRALDTLLSALIANASSHPEASTRKACFQV